MIKKNQSNITDILFLRKLYRKLNTCNIHNYNVHYDIYNYNIHNKRSKNF